MLGINTVIFEQIFRMRDMDMCGEPAIDIDANLSWLIAEVAEARSANFANFTADPRIDNPALTERNIFSTLTDSNDLALDFVTKREREIVKNTNAEFLVIAKIEKAVL